MTQQIEGAAEVKQGCGHCAYDRPCCAGSCCNCGLELPPRLEKPIQPPAAPIGQAKNACGCVGECAHWIVQTPAPAAEGEIDFAGVETWVKSRHPGIDKGDWEIARAYLALAVKVTELSAAWKAEKQEANDYCKENIALKQALTVANARVEELEKFGQPAERCHCIGTRPHQNELCGLWVLVRWPGYPEGRWMNLDLSAARAAAKRKEEGNNGL